MPILLPSQCIMCRISGNYRPANICPTCYTLLPRLTHICHSCALPLTPPQLLCGRCQNRTPVWDRIIAACPYQAPVNQMIRSFKDQGDFANIPILASLLLDCIKADVRALPDAVIPMPLSPWKRLRRGFNQTDLLAVYLGKALQIPVCHKGLYRKWTSLDQRSLSRSLREQNARRSFRADQLFVEGQRIALLDDVMTTGATLRYASQALKQAGALRVDGWIVARTL